MILHVIAVCRMPGWRSRKECSDIFVKVNHVIGLLRLLDMPDMPRKGPKGPSKGPAKGPPAPVAESAPEFGPWILSLHVFACKSMQNIVSSFGIPFNYKTWNILKHHLKSYSHFFPSNPKYIVPCVSVPKHIWEAFSVMLGQKWIWQVGAFHSWHEACGRSSRWICSSRNPHTRGCRGNVCGWSFALSFACL